MLGQPQVLFVTSEMQTKKCIVFPKVLSMIDVYRPQWHRSFLPCVFARIDVISFHGELKVLKGHENASLFISQQTAVCRITGKV